MDSMGVGTHRIHVSPCTICINTNTSSNTNNTNNDANTTHRIITTNINNTNKTANNTTTINNNYNINNTTTTTTHTNNTPSCLTGNKPKQNNLSFSSFQAFQNHEHKQQTQTKHKVPKMHRLQCRTAFVSDLNLNNKGTKQTQQLKNTRLLPNELYAFVVLCNITPDRPNSSACMDHALC